MRAQAKVKAGQGRECPMDAGTALDERPSATIGVKDAICTRENTLSATASLKWKL